ncbi:MAG: hypothetical protein WKF75_01850 [Singulisphaera sp.]
MATPPANAAPPEDETPGNVSHVLADDPDVIVTERAEPATVLRLPGIDNRERSLPIRQGDLTRLLLAEPGLSDEDRKLLDQFGRILGATFHSEFYEKLRELKELYAPLDPDADYVTLRGHTRPRSEHPTRIPRPLRGTLRRRIIVSSMPRSSKRPSRRPTRTD